MSAFHPTGGAFKSMSQTQQPVSLPSSSSLTPLPNSSLANFVNIVSENGRQWPTVNSVKTTGTHIKLTSQPVALNAGKNTQKLNSSVGSVSLKNSVVTFVNPGTTTGNPTGMFL